MTRNQRRAIARKRQESAVLNRQQLLDDKYLAKMAQGKVTTHHTQGRYHAKHPGKKLRQHVRNERYEGGHILVNPPFKTSKTYLLKPQKRFVDKPVTHQTGILPVISHRA